MRNKFSFLKGFFGGVALALVLALVCFYVVTPKIVRGGIVYGDIVKTGDHLFLTAGMREILPGRDIRISGAPMEKVKADLVSGKMNIALSAEELSPLRSDEPLFIIKYAILSLANKKNVGMHSKLAIDANLFRRKKLPQFKNLIPYKNLDDAIDDLNAKKIDGIVDAKYILAAMFNRAGISRTSCMLVEVADAQEFIYVYFSEDREGKYLKEQFDSHFEDYMMSSRGVHSAIVLRVENKIKYSLPLDRWPF
jgi:hypothetical protein